MSRRLRLLLLVVLALSVASAFGAPLASARPTPGIQSLPISLTRPVAQTDRSLDRAKRLGAKLLRVEVLWSQLEPRAAGERDPQLLAAIDHVVNGAAKRHMRVLLLVDNTPCWASTAPADVRGACQGADPNRREVTRYPPRDSRDYVAVSTFLAARYGKKLSAFEIWNEPDQSNELYWAGPDKVRRYVDLVKASYAPLKAANRQMTVLAGAFVGSDGRWLQAMYDDGIKGSYDALSVHFYDLPLYALRTTRDVQRHNGDRQPLWLAEFGFSSCYHHGRKDAAKDHVCLTRSGQARALSDTLNALRRTSWVKAAVVYALQDESTAYQFGLYDARGRQKPAYAAVRRAFAGRRAAITRPTLRLGRNGSRVVLRGTGSWVEVYEVDATGSGLAYRAYLRTDRFGRLKLALPAALGIRGVRVAVRGTWTRAAATRGI